MRNILGSLALLAALCLPAAAAETVLCRVSGYPAPTTCSTQPALLGTALPVAPGTATAGVATFAARADHRHPLQAKSYTLLTSGSGTYTVPANVTICDVSATGGGGGGGSGRRGTTAAGGGGGGPGGFTVKNSIPVTVLGASVAYTCAPFLFPAQ